MDCATTFAHKEEVEWGLAKKCDPCGGRDRVYSSTYVVGDFGTDHR